MWFRKPIPSRAPSSEGCSLTAVWGRCLLSWHTLPPAALSREVKYHLSIPFPFLWDVQPEGCYCHHAHLRHLFVWFLIWIRARLLLPPFFCFVLCRRHYSHTRNITELFECYITGSRSAFTLNDRIHESCCTHAALTPALAALHFREDTVLVSKTIVFLLCEAC